MKKKVYILYSTDARHSHTIKEVLGVYTNVKKTIKTLSKMLDKEGTKLSDDDMQNLMRIRQTQGREENFLIDEIELNKLY